MKLPLLFGRSELVEGDGFLARVNVSGGRALLTEEEDGQFCVEGVAPGGFAAFGETYSAALAKFCEEFATVLFDIASDAPGYVDFEAEVNRFFGDISPQVLADWGKAVEEVRAGTAVEVDWLKKQPADSPTRMQVTQVSMPRAAHNEIGHMAMAA